MKKALIASTVIAFFVIAAFRPAFLHTEIYQIDPAQSSLQWFAEKVTGKHNGTIKVSSGQVKNDHGSLHGNIEIDMTTIEVTDLQPGKGKEKLEGHLKSPDFFDVATYPKARFIVTSITAYPAPKEGGFTHQVTGNLTIKDKTNPITFDAIVAMQGPKITCTGSAIVDRTLFDVKYGSKKFFEDIGDKMIYDEFTLKFNIVASR